MKISYQRWPRGHSGTSSSVSSRTYRKTSIQKNMIISLQINLILLFRLTSKSTLLALYLYIPGQKPWRWFLFIYLFIYYFILFFIFRHFLCRPRLFWTTETGSDNGPAICQPASVPSWLSRVVCHGGFYSSLVVPIQRPRWAFHLSLRSCSSYFG